MPWTVKELAEAADVTTGYIRRLLIEGKIEAGKFGRDWAIPEEEAKKYLEKKGKLPSEDSE